MNQLIVIAGPTASGKTAVAVRLAQQLQTEIVSADSMQIYQYLNIGSAKPDMEERCGIVHHLMDCVSPFSSFSVKDYTDLAKQAIGELHSKGKIPILVGGTGLYINSLIDNVVFTETETDESVRQELHVYAEEHGRAALHELLHQCDPESAEKIHFNDVKRTIRAIELFRITGIPMSEHIRRSKQIPSPYELCYIGLTAERALLYERINRRVDRMMEAGLLQEVEGLLQMGVDETCQSMQGIGYKELIRYLNGSYSLDDAIECIKQESRRYAKRQLTWFRRDERICWFDSLCQDTPQQILEKVNQFLQ